MAERKEAMSLNQRHNRLLHDLSSASHSKNPNYYPPESHHTILGTRRLCRSTYEDSGGNSDGGGAPNFSGIVDFDSPSPELQAKVNKEEVVVSPSEQLEGEKNMASRNEFKGSTAHDLASKPGRDKPTKVKLEGRRRLCKVRLEDEHDHVDDHPSFSAVTDFDSPTPVKNVPTETNAGGGGDEIRDILNDLSSRLSILSIEKIGRPNKFSSSSVLKEGNNRLKMYALSEDIDDPLFPVTFKDYVSSLEVDHRQRVENVEPLEKSISSVEHLDESNDCVVTSGHNLVKKGESQHGKFRQDSSDSDVVHITDDSSDEAAPRENISITLTGPGLTYKLPDKIANMLYPHQREGLKWLWSLHCRGKGGILGDDMGLGKTMQICGFLVGLFHSRLIKRVLIVAPKTLLPHWIKELAAVGLSDKTREYFGTCVKARQYELQYILQDGGVLLTTYDIVRNNAKSLSGFSYQHYERDEDDVTWDYMVLDEGHLIKNPGTQRAKSLLEIPCAHRIIISGTPLQNNLKELWALFNFCCPELLGDKNCFKTKYESAILRGNEKNASDRDKRIGSAVAQDLRACIQPYFLRRLKSEVFHEGDATTAKLSKKNEIIVWLKLTSVQRRLYEAYLKSELVLSAFDGSPLAALTILKKICDHPLLLTKRAAEDVLEGMESVLTKEDRGVAEKLAMHLADVAERFDFVENHDNVSCKISFILSLLDNLIPDGHNVLIFSQTRKMLNLIQDSLLSRGYSFLRIDGTTKAADRLKIVNDFQEGIGAPIFLLTSQVGGLGLTLTKADRVIVVDPAWNPSTDNQSVDRAYRIGQTKNVIVYRLMTCGTVEEKIYRKQIYKGGLFKSATEHKEQIRYFSQQDLRELFSLPRQGFDVSPTQQQLHEEHDSEHTMDAYLKVHTEFLETLGIAGISHHSLLFSKTAPVPVVQEDELPRTKPSTYLGIPLSHSSRERDVDGAQYAFNPKDVNLQKKSNPQNVAKRFTESEIKEKIKRLSQVVSNKVMVSNLPDKGERLHKQIGELNLELDKIRMGKTKKEIINLDGISSEFNRVLNV